LAECVYDAFKAAILRLDFPPGAIIRKTAICEWFEFARSKRPVLLFETEIPEGLWSDLQHEGLIREDAHTP